MYLEHALMGETEYYLNISVILLHNYHDVMMGRWSHLHVPSMARMVITPSQPTLSLSSAALSHTNSCLCSHSERGGASSVGHKRQVEGELKEVSSIGNFPIGNSSATKTSAEEIHRGMSGTELMVVLFASCGCCSIMRRVSHERGPFIGRASQIHIAMGRLHR